jgi:hypothetical protein
MSTSDREWGPRLDAGGSSFRSARHAKILGRLRTRPFARLHIARAAHGVARDFARGARRATDDQTINRVRRRARERGALIAEAARQITFAPRQASETRDADLSVNAGRILFALALVGRDTNGAAVAVDAGPSRRTGFFRALLALVRVTQAARPTVPVAGAAGDAGIAVVLNAEHSRVAQCDHLAAAGRRRAFEGGDASVPGLA